MNMKSLLIGVLAFGLFACTSQQNKKEPERITDAKYTVLSDSIYTRMPGSMYYQDGLLYWEDPMVQENFMHVFDAENRKELLCFGNMGQGPEDFSFTLPSLVPSGFFINDLNKDLEIRYQVDKEKATLTKTVGKRAPRKHVTRILRLDDERMLYLCPGAAQPFLIMQGTQEVSQGVQPIAEQITNGYDMFQGNIAYHPDKEVLVFSALRFPYLAVYEVNGTKMTLEAECKEIPDYTLVEGEMKLPKGVKAPMELALTEDYIVTLQRDEVVEGEAPKAQMTRDTSTLPHSLFVYDYDLNLVKIINMSFPMLRLCGDTESNAVFAMGIDPEFMIVKIEL